MLATLAPHLQRLSVQFHGVSTDQDRKHTEVLAPMILRNYPALASLKIVDLQYRGKTW
jgi:hypothetical protein